MRFRWLKPDKPVFYDLFAKAGRNLVEGAETLAGVTGQDSDFAGISARLRTLESDSDELTYQLTEAVNSTFVTPFDRSDIYRLADALDDVMDHIEAAADLMLLTHFDRLDRLPAEMLDLIRVIGDCARATADALPNLRTMKGLHTYWTEVNQLESAGDKIYRKLVALLFNGDLDTLTVLKLKEVTDQLESALDAFETVANTVESIVVKES